MQTLYMLRGLPASGKTTMAQQMMAQNPKLRRVSKDDIRAMTHIGPWSNDEEVVTRGLRTQIITFLINSGFDVVVDDTNLNPVHEYGLRGVAEFNRIAFEIVDVDTPLEECIRRDQNRPFTKCVGEKVIRDMYDKYLKAGENV